MLEFIEKLAFMEEAARPSFETVEGLQQALGKKLFTQEDITQKRLAVHELQLPRLPSAARQVLCM